MPAEQVGESASYDPSSNVMANANASGVTQMQWRYIFANGPETDMQTTICYHGCESRNGDDVGPIPDGAVVGYNRISGALISSTQIASDYDLFGYMNPNDPIGSVRSSGWESIVQQACLRTTSDRAAKDRTGARPRVLQTAYQYIINRMQAPYRGETSR